MSDNKAHPVRQISGSLLGLLILFAAIIAGNVIVKNLRLRVDLTDEKRYSLSEGSANTMAKLEENVELQFYFSRSNPKVPMQLKAFAEQTEDFLREYERASKGKIKLTIVDPKPDTDEEDRAAQYGLQGVPLDMYGGPMYMGLVVLSGKHSTIMPIVDPQNQRFFEYEVSRMIYQTTHPQKPVVGVLSSLPVLGSAPQQFMMPGQPRPATQPAWFAFSDVKKDFNLREISTSEAESGIPSDVGTLVLVHPKELSDRALYAVDQFVLRGGHLVAFVDPSAYSDQSQPQSPYGGPSASSSDLSKLFTAWGVGYDPSRVILDKDTGMQVREGDRVVLNHAVLMYNASNVNKEDRATANLTTIRAIFAGALTDNTDDAITAVPLLSASSNSGSVPAMTAQSGSAAMKRDYRSSAVPQHLALKLTGTFKTAFPDGAPKEDTEAAAEPTASTENTTGLATGESTVVVVADVDMLADMANVEEVRSPFGMIRQPVSNNGVLLANLIDQLAGNQDLITIRSRAAADRSFTYVEGLRKKAQAAFEDKIALLQQQAQDAQQKINEMQQQKSASQRQFVSNEQRETIAKFQAQKREINGKIRQVQKDLRREIDTLGAWIKIGNIALMPLLVICLGIVVAVRKSRR
jgi:ABC-type uncharacterized transport system involved in gliding motility auxiliary subunit